MYKSRDVHTIHKQIYSIIYGINSSWEGGTIKKKMSKKAQKATKFCCIPSVIFFFFFVPQIFCCYCKLLLAGPIITSHVIPKIMVHICYKICYPNHNP